MKLTKEKTRRKETRTVFGSVFVRGFYKLAGILLASFLLIGCGGGERVENFLPVDAELLVVLDNEESLGVKELLVLREKVLIGVEREGELGDFVESLLVDLPENDLLGEVFLEGGWRLGVASNLGKDYVIALEVERSALFEDWLGAVAANGYERHGDVFVLRSGEFAEFEAIPALKERNFLYASWGELERNELRVDLREDGLDFVSSRNFVELDEEKEDELKADYKLGLIEKVPVGEGVVYYQEEPLGFVDFLSSLIVFLKKDLAEAALGASGLKGVIEVVDGLGVSKSAYVVVMEDLFKEFAKRGGVDFESAMSFMEGSAYAFAVNDMGALYPALSIYVDVEEGDLDLAKKFLLGMDSYLLEVLEALDKEAELVGAGKGVLQRDNVILRGAPFHKLRVDSSALPQGFDALPGLKDLDLQLYYGLSSDDVLVIALYPGFEEVYGGAVLAEDGVFLERFQGRRSVNYLQMGELVGLFDGYEELLGEDFAALKEVFARIWAISWENFNGNVIQREGRLRVEWFIPKSIG